MTKEKKLNKTALYAVLLTVASVAFIAFVCGIVLLVLWYTKNYSLWLLGRSSSEIIPVLLASSFILFAVPALTILFIEKKLSRNIAVTLISLCVLIPIVTALLTYLAEPEKTYTRVTSDNGKYTLVVCEADFGESTEVIFYQLLDGITMKSVSRTRLILPVKLPYTTDYMTISWLQGGFDVRYPSEEEGRFNRYMFSMIN